MVGMEDAELPFVSGNEALTSVNHSVAGNPDRLRHGLIRLRQDDRWRTGMARRDQRLVSVLTLPLLMHYGYALRPAKAVTTQVARRSSIALRAARALRGVSRAACDATCGGFGPRAGRASSRRTSSTR